ncbi:hypothetical protein [Primorskyibacter flagellatus]|uniref:Uncharacterized protein n=1 Tax=Primorskyibacter flagellatus TaxID=1387277 RepID=A0A1W2DUS2_9RHOB|nr:hypothetical protein [Primorskyibacter flagellatus]SMD01117.1 hypothetical protein SAMN06295998_11822 [Primorskyibacter flagellatus]
MSEFQATLDAVGIGGLLWGLAQCEEEDRELATSDASLVAPETVVKLPEQYWRLALQSCVLSLIQAREVTRVLMLGNDLGLLEALHATNFGGRTDLLLPPRVTLRECRNVAQNVPAGLDVQVLAQGLVPVLEARTTVVAIGFDAGSGYVMVDAAAARALGSVRGQRFTGDVIAILPLSETTIHDRRLDNWQMVRRDQFTDCCHPDGLEAVVNNV